MEYKVCSGSFAAVKRDADSALQNHMPVMPQVQKELSEAYKKSLPQAKK